MSSRALPERPSAEHLLSKGYRAYLYCILIMEPVLVAVLAADYTSNSHLQGGLSSVINSIPLQIPVSSQVRINRDKFRDGYVDLPNWVPVKNSNNSYLGLIPGNMFRRGHLSYAGRLWKE